jgi:hypothetical protein
VKPQSRKEAAKQKRSALIGSISVISVPVIFFHARSAKLNRKAVKSDQHLSAQSASSAFLLFFFTQGAQS